MYEGLQIDKQLNSQGKPPSHQNSHDKPDEVAWGISTNGPLNSPHPSPNKQYPTQWNTSSPHYERSTEMKSVTWNTASVAEMWASDCPLCVTWLMYSTLVGAHCLLQDDSSGYDEYPLFSSYHSVYWRDIMKKDWVFSAHRLGQGRCLLVWLFLLSTFLDVDYLKFLRPISFLE